MHRVRAVFAGLCCSIFGVFLVFPDNVCANALEVYSSPNCPACEAAQPFLEDLKRTFPELEIRDYDLFQRSDRERLAALAEPRGITLLTTPSYRWKDQLWMGDSPEHRKAIFQALQGYFRSDESTTEMALIQPASKELIDIPIVGTVDPNSLGLPILTLALGLLDSINPCAFFVLLFVLSFLGQAGSRQRMLLVGSVFVLCSGVVYFLFMAAWLNMFLLFGSLPWMTRVAGLLALVIASLNIKDFFVFKRGPSLSLSPEGRRKVTGLARQVRASTSVPALLVVTVLMALVANTYELFCTAGFPMVYTRALTLHDLPTWTHYTYLAAYNLIYILPLMLIVLTFAWTLGSHKLSEWEGRILKLFSGWMMALMGLTLLIKPDLLTSGVMALTLPALALCISLILIILFRKKRPDTG